MAHRHADARILHPAEPIGPGLRRILRERIVSGDLQPGARISESELAAHYGVSRQPVREALITLADEGLVQVRPQRGTTVSRINLEAVLDARFVREAIEADIVKVLASAPRPALIGELRRQLERQADAHAGTPGAFVQLDDQFHRTLAEAAGRNTVWTLVESLKAQMDRVRFIATRRFPTKTLIAQHTRLTDKIEAGDSRAAETVIRTHLRAILKDLPKINVAQPAYFEGDLDEILACQPNQTEH